MWGKKDEQASLPESAVSSDAELYVKTTSTSKPGQSLSLGAASPTVAAGTGLERGRNTAQIGKSLSIKGELSGSEDVYIDGEIEGTIELKENALTIGPNGKIHANVTAQTITILGLVQGSVRASERIDIRKTGTLEGDLVTARIVIEDGAIFRGSIDIIKAAAQSTATRPGQQTAVGLLSGPTARKPPKLKTTETN